MNFLDILSEEDLAPMLLAIQGERRQAEHVIVSLHWGPNMRQRPPGPFPALARRLLDAGADLVWGHSAHVVQGVELSAGKPILYDTGDLIDDYTVDPVLRNDLSVLFLVTLGPDGFERLEIVPTRISDCHAGLASADDASRINTRLARLSAELGTTMTFDGGRLGVRPTAGVLR
jgi:poly-gamma-glutamate synthesis protein (capsule biosynthesis protein)